VSRRPLPAGTVLEKNIVLTGPLGEGTFALTYLAHDRALKRDCVIKEYFPLDWAQRVGLQVQPTAENARDFLHHRQRFREEAELIARVKHKNLVEVRWIFEANGTHYFVMPYYPGETLAACLKRGPISVALAVDWSKQLLDGLAAFHAVGGVHRDIKPANIYLIDGMTPLLLDFGAARSTFERNNFSIVYTPGFAPHEQLVQGQQGAYTDVYAIGAVLYRLFVDNTYWELNPPNYLANPCLQAARDDVSEALRRVVDKALAEKIEARYVDALEMRQALSIAFQPNFAQPAHSPGANTVAGMIGGGSLPEKIVPRSPVKPAGELTKSSRWPVALASLVTAVALGLWLLPGGGAKNDQSTDPSAPPSKAPEHNSTPTNTVPALPLSSIQAAERNGVPAGLWHFYDQANQTLPKPDIEVSASLSPVQSTYEEGEIVNIEFTLSAPGYVAIFVHEASGGVRAIHPSVKSGKVERYAAGHHSLREQVSFRVSPPFGKDLVHVMAFSHEQDLRLLLDLFGARDTEQYMLLRPEALARALPSLTRSLTPMLPDEKSQKPRQGSRWGQAAIAFVTQARQ
jgi:serine/threonine protein kinase